MPDLTPERIAEIEARAAAATPGNWVYRKVVNPPNELGRENFSPHDLEYFENWIITEWVHPQLKAPLPIVTTASSPYLEKKMTIHIREQDAVFLAHARQDVPDLLAALKQAQQGRDQLEKAFQQFINLCEVMLSMASIEAPHTFRAGLAEAKTSMTAALQAEKEQ